MVSGSTEHGGDPRDGSRIGSGRPAFGPAIGGGKAWAEFRTRLERAATSGATLLLTGEHGVGKGWLARWVHEQSPGRSTTELESSAGTSPPDPPVLEPGSDAQSSGSQTPEPAQSGALKKSPLVEVDLSSSSPSLLESMLFGHEEGAFTGASGARLGAARRAHGGTLLLRGVHDLALELQVKLLRLLQERVVEPLGSERSIPVDIRLLATATENLKERVRAGIFREDLYYRLAVVVLEVPPLRVRFENCDAWLEDLALRAAQRVGRETRPLSSDAQERLAAYAWPGNVRQLENSLERALVMGGAQAGGTPIEASEFDFLGQESRQDAFLENLARQGLAQGVGVERWMGAFLERAMLEHRGRVAAAARAVGISRKAFEYRLQRYRAGQQVGSEEEGAIEEATDQENELDSQGEQL